MPAGIEEIVSIAAESAKRPMRPIVFGGIDKTGKPVLRKVEAQAEDLPEDQSEFNQGFSGQDEDDALVEQGLFKPLDKKLLGLS